MESKPRAENVVAPRARKPKNVVVYSPYAMFVKIVADEYKQNHPELSAAVSAEDVMKSCADKWQAMTDELRGAFAKLADVKNSEKGSGKLKRSKKQKDPNTPKRPRTAYIFYLQGQYSEFQKSHPNLKMAQVTSHIAKLWVQLDAEEKHIYEQLAVEDKARYDNEMKELKSDNNSGNKEEDTACASASKSEPMVDEDTEETSDDEMCY